MQAPMRILIALAALVIAGSALAQSGDPEAPVSNPARSSVADDDIGEAPVMRRHDPEEMVCKRNKPRTGSRVVRDRGDEKVCMTQSQWEHSAELGQEIMRERDRGICGGTGCSLSGH